MSAQDYASQVNRHYAPGNLAQTILDALRRSGKDTERLSPDDLAPFDQFHTMGKAATVELARLAEIKSGASVLDVGGGLGGPARTLAAEFGCRVTVLDITEEYCRVGAMLTERTGLTEHVEFRVGNALDMPFDDASFDVGWTQHSNMNIEDKETLYRELYRVLRLGGRLAIHEIMAGAKQPVHFPVPWAAQAAVSFLRPVAQMRSVIESSGFTELAFHDRTQAALQWFRERGIAVQGKPPPVLGLHLLLGDTFKPAFANQVRNLEEQRIAVIQAVYRKE